MFANSLARRNLAWALPLAALALVATTDARADEPVAKEPVAAPKSAPTPVSMCLLKGAYPPAKGTSVFDAPTGGNVIATLTGAVVAMQMTELPIDPTTGRAKITTSNGSPTVRITGYVPMTAIALFATRDIPAVVGHVWISTAAEVTPLKVGADSITVERTIAGSMSQKVRGTGSCDAFSLTPPAPTPMVPEGKSRGYMMKSSTLDFYDAPRGDVVFTLQMIEGVGQLFWSSKQQAGFVQIASRADISVDAWAKWRDLEALKKGEMVDQLAPPQRVVSGAQLAFDDPPRMAVASKEIPIRARRDEAAKPIGAVEAGAEIYVLETVAGWTHVLPKTLTLVPPDGGGFWIPAADAPGATAP